MKIFIGLFVAILAFTSTLALPAGSPNDDAEVIDVPRRTKTSRPDDATDLAFPGFDGVIDTGSGYPFLQSHPIGFSFNLGFFDAFEDILRRLRTRLWDTSDESDDKSVSAHDIGITNPFKNGNTTSTVKVVDGHKVEINETVYGDENNVFKVRIVNIQPLESGEVVPEAESVRPVTSGPSTDVEDDEDTDGRREPLAKKDDADNEIRGNIDEHSKAKSEEQREVERKKCPLAQDEADEALVVQRQVPQMQDNTMLPTNTAIEDDAANLNAAFVADNSLELAPMSDNATNEPENDNGSGSGSGNDNDNASNANVNLDPSNAVNVGLEDEGTPLPVVSSSVVENDRLTIENNEGAEVNDNFNESAQDDASIGAGAGTGTGTGAAATELDSDVDVEGDDEAIETATATTPSSEAEFFGEISENEREPEQAGANSSGSHSNYAINEHREDYSSSDDEDTAAGSVEMGATFNSEWAHIAEELANANDRNNELSNDIDAYDSVPIDLSNDIAVNDIAAAQGGYPLNPDAEFIDVGIDGVTLTGEMPQFEKLSIDIAPPVTPAQMK